MEDVLMLKLDEEAIHLKMFERISNLKRLVEMEEKNPSEAILKQKWQKELQILEKKI